ncbi:MAG: molybdate ABC transporter substrate-binding protein [Planctomycetota bacterium]
MRAACLVLFSACLACGSEKPAPDTVTVCAAASLREIATEIGDAWSQSARAKVEYRFESSDTLARQIQEGAPCDLFLSADPKWVLQLKPKDSFPWIGNRLVCVRLKGSGFGDLSKAKSLALGSEGTPIGRYSIAALKTLGITPPAQTIYGWNVRDVLSKVAEGAAEAGIVYATDVVVDPRVETAFDLPAAAQPKIVCPVALLHERGRTLYEACRAPAALDAAKRRGFSGP